MPDVVANGVRLHYFERGPRGDADVETVVFSHSYLVDHSHFRPQIDALAQRYRCIAFDHRDHGRSEHVVSSYALADLVDDAIGLLEALDVAPCHWIGLSTGGFVGMRIALRRPELLSSLVLMDTAGGAEPRAKRLKYRGMLAVLRVLGTRPLMPEIMRLFFSEATRADPKRRAELAGWRNLMASNDPDALGRFARAIFARDDVLDRLSTIAIPTLVMAGAEDRAIAPGAPQRLAEAIPGARLALVDDAAHLCTVERPDEVNAKLVEFLEGLPQSSRS